MIYGLIVTFWKLLSHLLVTLPSLAYPGIPRRQICTGKIEKSPLVHQCTLGDQPRCQVSYHIQCLNVILIQGVIYKITTSSHHDTSSCVFINSHDLVSHLPWLESLLTYLSTYVLRIQFSLIHAQEIQGLIGKDMQSTYHNV